MFLMCGIL
jgi:hypothetical protein